MKYILILLISFAFGQTTTINYMKEYAEECYNDSTYLGWGIEHGDFYTECQKDNKLLVNYNKDCKEIWYTKVPTFPGFIKWLEGE